MPDVRALVELVRGPAVLSVPGDVVAGATAAGVMERRTTGLAGASVCLYWAGMAANDWADRTIDAVERPERPIPSGRVSPQWAVRAAAGLTAAGVGLAGWAGGARGLAVAVPLAASVWWYDLSAKRTLAGPAVMAGCRGLDVLLGACRGQIRRALPAALTVAAHTGTVSVLSRAEVSGAGRMRPAATLAATAAVLVAAARRPRTGGTLHWTVVTGLAARYAAGYVTPQARALAVPTAARVRAAVSAGVTGLPPLQGALAARSGGLATGCVVAGAAPLARRLARVVSPT